MADETPPPEGDKTIHVDADWKREAQAEKERLARQAEEARAAGAAGGAPGAAGGAAGAAAGAAGDEGELPPADFLGLVNMLATQALVFMSDQRHPQTGQSMQRLDLAKYHVDLLGVLEEKTRGKLTPEEQTTLDNVLYELRMAYVSAAG